jgi:hypothetical protein
MCFHTHFVKEKRRKEKDKLPDVTQVEWSAERERERGREREREREDGKEGDFSWERRFASNEQNKVTKHIKPSTLLLFKIWAVGVADLALPCISLIVPTLVLCHLFLDGLSPCMAG